eukprot:Pgem_evm1s3564
MFRACGYLQILTRLQLTIEMLKLLSKMPLEVGSINRYMPWLLSGMFHYTHSGLEYTQKWIGSPKSKSPEPFEDPLD